MASGEDGAEKAAGLIHVEVAYSPASREVVVRSLSLPNGATVRQAVEASGLLALTGLDAAQVRVGIWGRATMWSHALRGGDRVELYRPLKADPKESRRLRYKKQRPAKRLGR
jgi:putative ubiquitin-RnfH superfamily antitoxin RatB of RatAB toxin-antitoxin module